MMQVFFFLFLGVAPRPGVQSYRILIEFLLENYRLAVDLEMFEDRAFRARLNLMGARFSLCDLGAEALMAKFVWTGGKYRTLSGDLWRELAREKRSDTF